MKIRVDNFREALELLEPLIARKTTLPITRNVLLKEGKAIATDFEKCVIVNLPEATDTVLIPHRDVYQLLKSVPGYLALTAVVENKELKLSWDGGEAAYDVADVKEFPPVPEVAVKAEGEMDGDALTAVLVTMAHYTTGDQKRPVLAGVILYLGERVVASAGDGFRMAYQELPLKFPAERVIDIPSETVSTLAHLWKMSPSLVRTGDTMVSRLVAKRNLKLSLDGDKAVFSFGRVSLIAKLIEGKPPEFKNLIPTPTNKVKVLAPDLELAVKRVSGIARDSSSIARLKWADSSMTVSAVAAEKGSVSGKLPAVTDDGPGRIALNVSYLMQYLSGKEDYVEMGITGDKSPVLFRYHDSPAVVMMPMFVQWE